VRSATRTSLEAGNASTLPAEVEGSPAASRRDSKARAKAGPLTPGRLWLFRFTALVGVPLLLFGGLELALRLLGYGYPTSFFVRNPLPEETNLVENRQFSRRYFAPELVRIPKPLAFAPAKSKDTLRVFVFGESAAEGDPASPFGFARILQVLLSDRYPERRIEVINTAVTAINSHVIRPIAREAARLDGDLWVIYMGNNEVVGPFGAGTVFGAQVLPLPLIRASVSVKATRTGQLLDDVLLRIGHRAGPAEWGGMEMFLQQQVRYNDPRMTRVYEHFQRNLNDMVRFAVGGGAKVVISTVGSNLRDCPPFASLHRADLPAAKITEWKETYEAGVALEQQGEYAAAQAHYLRAAELDDEFADLQYRLGRCEAALGRTDVARQHFTKARDLDTLRFRADSRINEIIRQMARDWGSRGVRLAEVERALAAAAPDGIIGAESFHEHVHLTFAGNFLVARAIAEEVFTALSSSLPAGGSETHRAWPTREECERRLGLTDCERLRMEEEMWRRTGVPPFTHQLDHAADAARRTARLAEARERDRTNFLASVALYREALARAGKDWQLHDNFAGALVLHGDYSNAVIHLREVARLLPHHLQTYNLLGSVLLDQARWSEAEACYQQARRVQRDYLESWIGLGRIHLAQNRSDEAIECFRRAVKLQPRSGRTHNHLGVALQQLNRAAEAETAFRRALQVEPDFLAARMNLGSALLAQGRAGEAIEGYQELLRLDPSNTAARIKLGKTYAQQGRHEEALGQYVEAVRLQPDDFEARAALGNALIRAQRLAEATEQLAAAVQLDPTSFEARANYGSLLAGQGKTAEARRQFEQALRLKPGVPALHLNLALALLAEDQPGEAIAQLREVLRLEPGNVRAQQLLRQTLDQNR
jgi:tetratricopeptide (TPR) repeat protein